MQRKLNRDIKFRESFRPFAPSVPAEFAGEYFEPYGDSPYMLFVRDIKKQFRMALPENYFVLSPEEKLSIPVILAGFGRNRDIHVTHTGLAVKSLKTAPEKP